MKTIIATLFFVPLFFSCGLQEDTRKRDTPTSGNLKLYYDEGITLQIENQVYTFLQTYKNANIQLIKSNEQACVEALFNDSCKVIALSRNLSSLELKKFAAINLVPNSSVVAKDAIAFIVSTSFTDSVISLTQLTALLKGNDSSYVSGKYTSIIFDHKNSGSARQLKDSLLPNTSFGKNCSAVNSTPDLIDAIAKNPNAIGVCDYAWLSDKDDVKTKAFLKKIKVLAVSKKNNETAYMPDQSNIATALYPLCRNICIIRRSAEFSLGKGIETFIAGDRGQLMFLKQGLAPNRQEERLIEIDIRPLK